MQPRASQTLDRHGPWEPVPHSVGPHARPHPFHYQHPPHRRSGSPVGEKRSEVTLISGLKWRELMSPGNQRNHSVTGQHNPCHSPAERGPPESPRWPGWLWAHQEQQPSPRPCSPVCKCSRRALCPCPRCSPMGTSDLDKGPSERTLPWTCGLASKRLSCSGRRLPPQPGL